MLHVTVYDKLPLPVGHLLLILRNDDMGFKLLTANPAAQMYVEWKAKEPVALGGREIQAFSYCVPHSEN